VSKEPAARSIGSELENQMYAPSLLTLNLRMHFAHNARWPAGAALSFPPFGPRKQLASPQRQLRSKVPQACCVLEQG
jgi:hypothetical protein